MTPDDLLRKALEEEIARLERKTKRQAIVVYAISILCMAVNLCIAIWCAIDGNVVWLLANCAAGAYVTTSLIRFHRIVKKYIVL